MSDSLTIGGVIPGGGTCCVQDCGRRIRKGLLMCAPHWSRVPGPVRDELWAALDAWENDRGTLGSLRDAQEAAVEAALAAVVRAVQP